MPRPMLRIFTLMLLIWLPIACAPINRSSTTSSDLVIGISTPEDTVRHLEAQRYNLPYAEITIDAMRETTQGLLIFYTVPKRIRQRDRKDGTWLCVARPHHDRTGWRLHAYEDTWCVSPAESEPPQPISCNIISDRFEQDPKKQRLILFGRRIDPRVVALDLVDDPPHRETLSNGIFYVPISFDGELIQLRDAQDAVISEAHTNKLCL